ncbi:myb-like protein P isoform X3 [Centruroides sculpturatus]|uniref:myb-like protein P isoform X3 n=1 Tax=Centruroides sculpturatus TaxID=218467 RepID=UPI000C6DDDB4|nr:myb-like protein P isoform X3 [Centruroides sculpturatus]
MTSVAVAVDQSAMAKNGMLVCSPSAKEDAMRLKRSIRTSHEDRFLLQNQLNQQNEDKVSSLRTRSGYRVSPSGIRIQQGWHFFQNHNQQSSPSPTKTSQCGYNPNLASPLEDMSDQAMSLSSPEDISKNGTTEDDSLSDLEYTETSPLLTGRNLKKSLEEEDDFEDLSEDYNNNNNNHCNASSPEVDPEDIDSEDSLFSDSSDMSDQAGKDCYVLENTYNNNNFLENNTRDQLYIGDEKQYADTQLDRRSSDEKANPTLVFCNSSSESPKLTEGLQKGNNLPDVLPLDATKSPSSGSGPDTNDVSPMSDISCSSDLDVNIASNQAFNNFSIPLSKHNDIQCLVQDTVQQEKINIREFNSEQFSTSFEESKILNTVESLPRNMTKEYQHQLRNRSGWNHGEDWQKSQNVHEAEEKSITPNKEENTQDNREQEFTERCEQRAEDLLKILQDSPANMVRCPERINDSQRNGLPVDLLTGTLDANGACVPPPYFGDENHNCDVITSSLTPEDNNAVELTPKIRVEKKSSDQLGDFDVYNIETAMPTIDWVAMEAHLTRAAKEDDWLKRRRNDREEIRRKLAMDSDSEDYYLGERVTRKPSLTTRLQSGMNLQICFMNETASDQESQGSDQDGDNSTGTDKEETKCLLQDTTVTDTQITSEDETEHQKASSVTTPLVPSNNNLNNNNNEAPTENLPSLNTKRQRPSFFFNRQRSWRLGHLRSSQHQKKEEKKEIEEDFFTRHARLQAEARMALAQAKEMARMQMEVERQRKKKSPIAEIVGLPFPNGKHRLSRHILTDMNVAQLQVIVNDLHSQIEGLNEELVRLLLERDDLHMEQDSMLVDIEDLTRYLGAKDEAMRNQQNSLKKPKSTKK